MADRGGSGGDDGETPPKAPFENDVPRRARSNSGDSRRGRSGASRTPGPTRGEDGPAVAPSAGREEEHPEDAENGGGGGALGGLLPEEDDKNGGGGGALGGLLPEEDAKNGGGGGGWLHTEEDLRDLMEYQQDAENGGGGGAPLAPSRTDEASSSSGRERPADDCAEKDRIRKGKMPSANNDDARAEAAAPEPGGGGGGGGSKLMGDAIRSHGGAAVPCSKKKPRGPSKSKKRKDPGPLAPPFWYGFGSDGQSTSTAGSDLDYSFDTIGIVSDRLRAALAGLGLGPAAPRRVYGRMLSRCDRTTDQARLQISCKSWRAEDPFSAFLTKPEMGEVRGMGLPVSSYDRRGEGFELNVRYLKCNRSFRVIGNWSNFLRKNGLDIKKGQPAPMDVMLDLWLFRTPEGKVGMVVLHYRKGDAAHADAAFDEVDRRTRARLQGADAAAEEPPPSPPEKDEGGAGGNNDAAAMEDVAGDAGEKGQDDAGVNDDAAPSDQPDGGAPTEAAAAPLAPDADGSTKTEEKETGGAPMAAAAAAKSSSEAGGAASKAGAREEADGTKTEEKETSAPTRVTAAQSSSSDKLEAAPPSTPDAGVPGKAMKQGPHALLQRSGLNFYDMLGAFALVLMSQGRGL